MRRPREGRLLAGVAAGIADHLRIDVVLVRILIVVLAIVTQGLGVLAYIAGAVFIPPAEPGAQLPPRHASPSGDRDPLFWLGLGALILGALWLGGGGVGFSLLPGGFRDLFVPLALIGVGLALWRAGDRRAATSGVAPPSQASAPPPAPSSPSSPSFASSSSPPASSSSPPASPQQPASSERSMTTDTTARIPTAQTAGGYPPAGEAGGAPPTPPWTGQPGDGSGWTPPPPPERRPRSLLTRITLGSSLVTVGVLWSLDVAGVLAIGWGTILAAALLVIGIGLLIGSVVGRARWLILVGALIMPLVLVAQVGPFPLLTEGWTIDSASAGEIRSTPSDLADLRSEYQLGAGSVRLDLRELDFDGQDVAVRVDVGAGEIVVVVPEDIEVVATARTGIGEVQLFDDRRSTGFGAGQEEVTFTPEVTPRGRLELDLRTGLGEILVRVQAPADGTAAARPEPLTSGA